MSFKTRDDISNEIKNDIKNNIPLSQPFNDKTIFSILATILATRIRDIYNYIENIIQNIFDNLVLILGQLYAIPQKVATQSQGMIIFQGLGTVPSLTEIQDSNLNLYVLQNETIVFSQSQNLLSLTQTGGIATATFSSSHNLATGMNVVIAGATPSAYNGTKIITVNSDKTFTFTIDGGTTSSATGIITSTCEYGLGTIKSKEYGSNYNLLGNTECSLTTNISGVSNTCYIQYSGLTGGLEAETDAVYKIRLKDEVQNPKNIGSINFWEDQTKQALDTITKVWVKPITPEIGKFTIYAVKNNENPILLTSLEIANIKTFYSNYIPINQDINNNVILVSPTLQTINFSFASITPDTATMRASIENNLRQFFLDESNVGEDIKKQKYMAIISNSFDETTGDVLDDFTLTTPTGDISVATGNLAIFETIIF